MTAASEPGPHPSRARLVLLRATYLLLVVGLGFEVWPNILHRAEPWEHMEGVVQCILGSVALCALLGIRYPVKMLPLLFLELAWKGLWLLVVALPAYRAGAMDNATANTAFACAMGVIFVIAIPWRYAFREYLRAPSEPWW